MLEQIDRIVQIDLYLSGVLSSGSYTDLAKDFFAQLRLIGDKLHIHLNETMPNNYW